MCPNGYKFYRNLDYKMLAEGILPATTLIPPNPERVMLLFGTNTGVAIVYYVCSNGTAAIVKSYNPTPSGLVYSLTLQEVGPLLLGPLRIDFSGGATSFIMDVSTPKGLDSWPSS